jgi:hypothetical protein
MEKENSRTRRTAKLVGSDGHHAVGTVVITTDQNGVPILRLKDNTVDQVPEGRVYLARNEDYRNGVELGKRTQFEFPASVMTLPISSQRKMDLHGAGAATPATNRSVIIEFEVDDVDKERARLQGFISE